jgi:hypothetical protein
MEEEPMDRLEAMSTFMAVVETGSLSAAARQLRTPLPTVSRKVSSSSRTCGRSCSTGRAASWSLPMQAAPILRRASEFWLT